jgi:hypothetical protein
MENKAAEQERASSEIKSTMDADSNARNMETELVEQSSGDQKRRPVAEAIGDAVETNDSLADSSATAGGPRPSNAPPAEGRVDVGEKQDRKQ